MSTPFYDLASLVVVPSGYKASKVYAQKPLTTDGQLAFTRASTATRVNSAGLIETVSSNVPRLDYQGATCGPRLLLEPQRTNSFLQSSNYVDAVWEKNQISASSSSGISPDGTNNAVKILPSTSSAAHFLAQNTTLNAGTVYTHTIYAKADGYNFVQITGSTGFSTSYYNFNLSNGTLGSTDGGVASIESAGNGWYRIRYTLTAQTSTSGRMVMGIVPSASSSRLAAFAGDGTSGVLFYGAQIEAGSYPTSLINTSTATVTRLADDCVKSSATSIIGQTEGVVFFEWEYQNTGSSGGNIPISLDGPGGDEIYFWVLTTGSYRFDVGDSGVGQVSITGSMGSFGTKKIALAYKNNDFALYINGVLAGTDTSGTVPTCNRLHVGRYYSNTSYNISSGIKQVLLFPTRLTNAQLAELTAL